MLHNSTKLKMTKRCERKTVNDDNDNDSSITNSQHKKRENTKFVKRIINRWKVIGSAIKGCLKALKKREKK